ncbi:MAG: hypothetical protein H0W75_11740 [Chitinophagaceae bacterium]|nr:hypothetical protein [Chitinophagaceae bacterium]
MTPKEKAKQRQIIFDKYNGKCAYCGCNLIKGWHTSPIQPIEIKVGEDGSMIEENNTISNIVGACVNCAMSKTHIGMNGRTEHLTIENFKKAILQSFDMMKETPYYKRAIKFGLITESDIPLRFHFEQKEGLYNNITKV